jgi:hypothetical protein
MPGSYRISISCLDITFAGDADSYCRETKENFKTRMENKSAGRAFLPILYIFIGITAIFFGGLVLAEKWNVDSGVVLVGNMIIFLATAISFYLYLKAIRNNNVHAFLRMIYGGMFLKMLLCIIAAFIYFSVAGKTVNKAAIFICMFLYFVYTFSEVAILMKLSKQQKNA